MLGVDYLHLLLEDGSDLYVTEHGLPFLGHLLPQNHWTDRTWFAEHSVRLPGTSTLYRIETKKVDGRSKLIVLKWNRMGQDIPGETGVSELDYAEFNSPFEEFSLVTELRDTRRELPGRLYTHKPLAIYVPRKFVEADRLGRKPHRIEAMQKGHEEITLHPNRQYAVLYEWMKGIDSPQAVSEGLIDENAVLGLWAESNGEMGRRGFRVRDSKAHHIIVRPTPTGTLARDDLGGVLYGLVDFELLERTPERELAVRATKRRSYLVRQAHRFDAHEKFPSGLASVNVMDVDYVSGPVESTGGSLWVVGRDPGLFDYFLPEKWRKTPREKLSASSQVYETVTKDNIHLVWRVSKVGEVPDVDPFEGRGLRILSHGYNSPFEEVSLNIYLSTNGIETTYPRAIYMTGHRTERSERLLDNRRHKSHETLMSEADHPILSRHHDYITVWGYWNGPDELLAEKDEDYYRSIDALRAYRAGLITEEVYLKTMAAVRERLAKVGVEDLNLNGSHLLLSLDRSGLLVTDHQGLPAARICNFELLKRIR